MNTGNGKQAGGRLRKALTGFSMRARIALSVFLAFVVVLPIAVLTLASFSGLTATMRTVTERDVRLGKIGDELVSTMRDITRVERNYRIFGGSQERSAIERLIAREDSLIEIAGRIAPRSEQDAVRNLARIFAGYRNAFSFLVRYQEANPPGRRMAVNESALSGRLADFSAVMNEIRMELENAEPGERDSLLAETGRRLDLLAFDFTGVSTEEASSIQSGIEAARNGFLLAAGDFAASNWEMMDADLEKVLRIEERAKRNIIFVLILTAMVSVFMLIRLPGYIVKPITGLNTILRRAASGEREIAAPVSSRDEIGMLAASYNQALERLRSYDDLKTKKISSQKRSIDRLIDFLNVPVCILSKNMTALYYNALFAGLYEPSVPHRTPENGVDLAQVPELRDFVEQIRKRMVRATGDFRFSITSGDGVEIPLKGRLIRNVALNVETIIVVGDEKEAAREG